MTAKREAKEMLFQPTQKRDEALLIGKSSYTENPNKRKKIKR